MQHLSCGFCNGAMETREIPVYNKHIGISLVILGLLFSITLVGIFMGVILLGCGVYILVSKKNVWICNECHTLLNKA